jgi:hypothetical protein
MDDEQMVNELRTRGYRLDECAIRTDGMMLYQVNEQFMFRQDAVDLAAGRASLVDIMKRNRGRVFPDASDLELSERDEEILRRVDAVAQQVVLNGGIEIHVAFPFELTERENGLVQRRIACWLKGRARVR